MRMPSHFSVAAALLVLSCRASMAVGMPVSAEFVDAPITTAQLDAPETAESERAVAQPSRSPPPLTATPPARSAASAAEKSARSGASKAVPRAMSRPTQRTATARPASKAKARAARATRTTSAATAPRQARRSPASAAVRSGATPKPTAAQRARVAAPLAAAGTALGTATAAAALAPSLADGADELTLEERSVEGQRAAIASLQSLQGGASTIDVAQLQASLRDAEKSRQWSRWGLGAGATVLTLLLGCGAWAWMRRPASARWKADPAPAGGGATAKSPPAEQTPPVPRAASPQAVPPAASAGVPPSAVTPPVTPPAAPPAAPPTAPPTAPPAAYAAAPVLDVFIDTAALVGNPSPVDAAQPLPCNAEALIDLAQQADFFEVLGQDDAAVSLLTGFMRGAGAACPLPCLKLLSLHRRRGDRQAHALVRAKYRAHFGADAPGWDAPLVSIAFEDEADLLRPIVQAWRDPTVALRRIERMLVFGRTREMWLDLNALDELQFLYLLARSVQEMSALPDGGVDILLPLSIEHAKATPTVDLELDFSSTSA